MNDIKAGKLRERVKNNELCPKAVLEWLHEQGYVSPAFERWLRRRK